MRHILVIDDEPTVCTAVALMLRMRGFTVAEAKNGEDGLAKARAHPPQLIVSDLHMPVMDGFETLEEIRKDPLLHAIPFVVITGFPSEASELRLRANGVNAILTKPFTLQELVAAVEAHFPGHNTRQPTPAP